MHLLPGVAITDNLSSKPKKAVVSRFSEHLFSNTFFAFKPSFRESHSLQNLTEIFLEHLIQTKKKVVTGLQRHYEGITLKESNITEEGYDLNNFMQVVLKQCEVRYDIDFIW